MLIHYSTIWPWPLTPWPWRWPLTLNICSVSPVPWWNYVPNVDAIEQSAAQLLQFQCLTLWPWTCCARLWGDFHQVWPSTTYPCLNYSVFMLIRCHAGILTFDPLTSKDCGTSSVTWSKSVQNLSEIEQSPAELLIKLRIFAHVVTLWPWPLTSIPWTFEAFRVSCVETPYKIWAKSNDPRMCYRRFSAFSRAILGGGSDSQLTELSQGCVNPTSPNLART